MKKSIIIAFLAFSATVASAQIWNSPRVEVLSHSNLINLDGQVMPFTTSFLRDTRDPLGACIMVLRDNTTGQFAMTSVGTQSCVTD